MSLRRQPFPLNCAQLHVPPESGISYFLILEIRIVTLSSELNMLAAPDPLKPLDVVVALWIAAQARKPWQRLDLARVLEVSPSMISYATQRLRAADILTDADTVRLQALDAIIPAVRWIYPAAQQSHGRGMPTAHAAPGMSLGVRGRAYVWAVPARKGPIPSTDWVEGTLITPIHTRVPVGASNDPVLYELMAALDAMRVGDPRLHVAGRRALEKRLHLAGAP